MTIERIAILFACLSQLAFGADEWARVTEPPALVLPRDHGAHPEHRTEWWYATGELVDDDGARFGFQITFFRNGFAPGAPSEAPAEELRAGQVLLAHLAIVDQASGELLHAERMRRVGGELARASVHDMDVRLDGWSFARVAAEDGERLRARAVAVELGAGLELSLVPQKPLVAHGDGGLSQKGPEAGNASVYLSWTRLAVAGRLFVGGRWREVTGGGWFDHEWGTSQLGDGVVGWDWFALRLDDGRELMLYGLRDGQGAFRATAGGSLVERDGSVTALARDDFSVEVRERWKSPHSDADYPASWRLAVPRAGLELSVRAVVPDCELDTGQTTGVVYWEGPVAVEDPAGQTLGRGYAELTGYADGLGGRF